MVLRKIITFLTFTICITFYSVGQIVIDPSDYNYFHSLSIEEGLSQSNVNAILKDSEGYVWIGTEEGLNRFDGYEFKIFRNNPNDSTSLAGNLINKIFEDSQNRLWIGMSEDGINLYDRTTESFRNWSHTPTNENSIYIGQVRSLIEDKNANLYVVTYGGVTFFNTDNYTFQRIPDVESHGFSTETNTTLSALEIQNKIIVGKKKGLRIIQMDNQKSENLYFNQYPIFADIDLDIETIIPGNKNEVWIVTNSHGVYGFNINSKSFRKVNMKNPDQSNHSVVLWSGIKNPDNTYLFGTDGDGVFTYDPTTELCQKLTSINYPGLVTENIRCIYQDEENVWFGTYNNGILFMNKNRKKFLHYQYFDDLMHSNTKNSVLAIAKDKESNYWIGTDGSGLYKFSPRDKTFENYSYQNSLASKLSGDVIKSLAYDPNNNVLYAGTYNRGLNVIDLTTHQIEKYLPDPSDSNSINSYNIWSILIDRDERVWLATLDGGLDEFLPDEKRFLHHTINIRDSNSISNNHLNTLFEDSSGSIWIGASGGSINRFDKQNEIFTKYFEIHTNDTSFLIGEPNEIFEDSKHNLWILIQGAAAIYDRENDKFVEVYKESLGLSYPQSMIEDHDGNLWVSTSNGIIKINPTNEDINHFDYKDGLQSNEFNKNSKFIDSTGVVIFGGLNGLTIFDPGQITENKRLPKVIISSILLFRKELEIDPSGKILTKSPNYMDEIEISQEDKVISIKFSALDFHLPKQNEFAYLLEGFDKQWNYVGNTRVATYTNLPPGEYFFKVKTTNTDNIWTDPQILTSIHVLPRWHQLLWVRILLILVLIGFIYFNVKMRTIWLLNKKERLEKEIKQRTKELEDQKSESTEKNHELLQQNEVLQKSYELINDQNKELKQINEEINIQRIQINEKSIELEKAHQEIKISNDKLVEMNSNLEKKVQKRTDDLKLTFNQLKKSDETLKTFLYRSSHDLREPVTNLLGTVLLAEKESQNNRLRGLFNKISVASHHLLKLLEKLDKTNIIFKTEFRTDKINWEALIDDVKEQLQKSLPKHNVKIKTDISLEHEILSNSVLIKTIIYNLLENALVFTSETENPFAYLSVSEVKNTLVIKVMDNGAGIEEEIRDKIFDMFYRGSSSSIGNGLGLFMVQKAVKNLNGTITLSSTDKMTEFIINIPINKTKK